MKAPALAAFLGWAALSAAEVRGADCRLIPAASLQQEYNDNILFSDTASRSSFITTPSAQLTLIGQTERLGLELNARLDQLLYGRDRSLNAVEQRYAGRASYLLTPLLRIEASAAFSRESRPDRYVEATGLVVSQKGSNRRYAVAADARLTERLAGNLAYGYDGSEYRDAAAADVAEHAVRGTVRYDLGGVVPRAAASYSSYRFSSSSVQNGALTAGASYPLHELWSLQGDLGARLTEGTGLDLGWLATVAASYQDEADGATLSLSRELRNAAGRSGTVESTAVSLQLTRKLSRELLSSLGAAFYRNVSSAEQLSSGIDETTIRVNPAVQYKLSRDLALEVSYELAVVQNHQVRTEAWRNKIFIVLTVQRPFTP